METRVFSLSARTERQLIVIVSLWYFGITGFWLHASQAGPLWFALSLAFLALVSVWWYRKETSRKLEVSDAGLVYSCWPRTCIEIDWGDIGLVRLLRESAGFLSTDATQGAIVWHKDTRSRVFLVGLVFHIPGASPDSAEIMRIFKERLPAEMFEQR